MESQSEGEKEVIALLVHSCQVRADRAKGIGAVLGSEAAGDFLFHLRHAHRLLGEVIGERDVVIGSEAPDILGIGAQAQEEVCRLALSRSTAFSRFLHPRTEGIAFVENYGISGTEICKALKRQRPPGLVHLMARGHQEFDHAAGPDLAELLKQVDQFPQVMRIAQPVLAEQIAVRFPAIVDERAQQAGENPQRIEGQLPPIRVAGDPSEHRRCQRVHPVQLAGNAHSGFVGVGDIGRLKGLADQSHRRYQTTTSLFTGGQHRALRHRQAKEVAPQRRRALHRHHVLMRQMNHSGQCGRPVLHGRNDAGRKLAPANLAAGGTLAGKHLVLGNLEAQRGKVEHLTSFSHR